MNESQRRIGARLLVGALILTTLSFAQPAAAEDDIILTNGTTLTGSLTARSITVPTGATVSYAGNIVLTATQAITVNGRLQSSAPTSGEAFSLQMLAGTFIYVGGSVVSAAGTPGSAATNATSATGTDGGSGGPISFQWGTLSTFTLADGAYVQSGAGGMGGSANVTTSSVSGASLSATGGNGGNGGPITFSGQTAVIQGSLRIGNGARGGDASFWTTPDPTTPPSSAEARGGDGGVAGQVALPTGYTLAQLHANGQIIGGIGGEGGAATGGNNGELVVASACGGNGHWGGGTSTKDGQTGCPGYTATGTGGSGGCATGAAGVCLVGGNGGNAGASGGPGGQGGRGANGQIGLLAADPFGGKGGTGGQGGWTYNRGGRGGNGILQGGNGGSATGSAGRGGNGGGGGNGGYSYGIQGSLDYPQDCMFLSPICWVGIEPSYVCGHVGQGGSGGSGNSRDNAAGAGGSGAIAGSSGTISGSSWTSGNGGAQGSWSTLTYCSHTINHGSHI